MHALVEVVVSSRSHFLEGFIVNPYSCSQSDNTELLDFFQKNVSEILFLKTL